MVVDMLIWLLLCLTAVIEFGSKRSKMGTVGCLSAMNSRKIEMDLSLHAWKRGPMNLPDVAERYRVWGINKAYYYSFNHSP